MKVLGELTQRMSVILAFGRLGQKDPEFQLSLGLHCEKLSPKTAGGGARKRM